MGVFKQLGALIGKGTKPKLNIPKMNPLLRPLAKEVQKLDQYQDAAYAEMEKNILAPVIREDSRGTLSEEDIDRKLKELEERNSFPPDYINMLDSVEVNKPRELDEIGSTLNQPMEDRYSPSKYKKSLSYEGDETKNPIPKGKCDPGVLADMITNHQQNPAHWNTETISEHLSLRESDVANFLAHFDLITEHSNFMLNEECFGFW